MIYIIGGDGNPNDYNSKFAKELQEIINIEVQALLEEVQEKNSSSTNSLEE